MLGTRKVQKRKSKLRAGEIRRRKRDFLARIDYWNLVTVAILPLATLVYLVYNGLPLIPHNQTTTWCGLVYFNLTMLSFTCGYHKYFAHKLFSTSSTLATFMVMVGSLIGVGSVRWWAAMHRAHHHHVDDVEKDPYSVKRGLLWAHWGWLLRKPKRGFLQEYIEHEFPLVANESDDGDVAMIELANNASRRYLLWFAVFGLIVPTLMTMFLSGDLWMNSLIYVGLLRMVVCQQAILLTESVCHSKSLHFLIPSQPFTDKNLSVNANNPLMSLLTYGQAHQNFHHEFPHDYRSTLSTLAYDPTKWCLFMLLKFGLVWDLCRTPENLIMQLRIQQQQKIINRMKLQLNWGTPISKLPIVTPQDFKRICDELVDKERIYIVIQNIIHDITPFMDQHPGGVPLLKALHGKDATKAFYGGVYGHLAAATNLLATMRIGVLSTGNEEDVWRRVAEETVVEERALRAYQLAEAA